jgi:hypothetical protein
MLSLAAALTWTPPPSIENDGLKQKKSFECDRCGKLIDKVT